MTYNETLDWMFNQLPMYQNKGKKAFNSKLDGIQTLTEYLNHPHHNFKSIHVAGTNGKGSSSHMLASILQEAGYTVGLYTSPHLKDFRERIRISGKKVSEDFVIDFIDANRSFIERNKLSFFEMTVGIAFDFFSKQKVDIAIIETGLGGRLDSTNIITPEVSLITNIGLDHTDMLGDTLVKIAFEKAGIIKSNVPVVVSEYQDETIDVFTKVSKGSNSKLVIASKEGYRDYKTDLLGKCQKKNVKGVLGALEHLKGFKISENNIVDGFLKVSENTGLLGRWQIIGERPKIVCDTAHNVEGLSIVVEQLKEEVYAQLHIVLGFVKGKDLSKILPLLPQNAIYYFCKPKIFRGLDEVVLKELSGSFGLLGGSYNSVDKAFSAAKKASKADDLIYVGGSTFVVAEVL